MSGRRVLVLAVMAHGLFGYVFLGLYVDDGKILYEATHAGYEIWDVQRSERGIVVLGAGSRLEISLPD